MSSKVELRPFSQLGSANYGWLDTHHHFSFADYFDPKRLNWGKLRVWNDDIVSARRGFGAHPHANMEIISYVYKGAISHGDHLGNVGRTAAGDVQVMTAGTGVVHSEYNLEDTDSRFFQIWITPTTRGHPASFEQRRFPKGDRANRFEIFASGFEDDKDAIELHTDGRVAGATINKGQTIEFPLGPKHLAYLVPAAGKVEIGNVVVNARDGAAIKDTDVLKVTALEDSEVVLVDTID